MLMTAPHPELALSAFTRVFDALWTGVNALMDALCRRTSQFGMAELRANYADGLHNRQGHAAQQEARSVSLQFHFSMLVIELPQAVQVLWITASKVCAARSARSGPERRAIVK